MIDYYTVENTGWSGGVSWFKNDYRFDTFQEALAYAHEQQTELNDSNTFWRVVRVTVKKEENKETITREWSQLP
jgi:hypothetical protein